MVKWLLGLLCGQSQAALTSSKAALTIPYCIKKKSTRPLLWRLKFGFGTWLYESPSASPSSETGFRKRSSRHKTANAVVARSNDFLSGCMRLRRESKEFLEKLARPSGHQPASQIRQLVPQQDFQVSPLGCASWQKL